MNGSLVSVLISDVGVECRCGELVWAERVWKPGSFHGVLWSAQCGYWTFSQSNMSRSCRESSHQRFFVGHITGSVEHLHLIIETDR